MNTRRVILILAAVASMACGTGHDAGNPALPMFNGVKFEATEFCTPEQVRAVFRALSNQQLL